MKSYLAVYAVVMKIRHPQAVYGIADLAERLRRTLKARVRKSVGSIPTVRNNTYFFGMWLGFLRPGHLWLPAATDPYVRV
jgi:hypothetical protein